MLIRGKTPLLRTVCRRCHSSYSTGKPNPPMMMHSMIGISIHQSEEKSIKLLGSKEKPALLNPDTA